LVAEVEAAAGAQAPVDLVAPVVLGEAAGSEAGAELVAAALVEKEPEQVAEEAERALAGRGVAAVAADQEVEVQAPAEVLAAEEQAQVGPEAEA
jgi:hypothetical protein